jgi:NAD(P)-dependent dehydrogenase (short-subunit alcohol dehydrogenase family)
VSNLFDLSGRVAIVMGGTSGIGRAIAFGLADAGADVIATGRRHEKVAEAAAEIEKTGRRSMVLTADASSRDSVDRFRDAVLSEFNKVHILVNAAGQTFRKATVNVSETEWNDLMDVNLNGTLRACQSFFPALESSGHGRVINIASLTSYLGFMEVAAYATSKSAVLGLTRCLAVEWASRNVNVNAIAPGVFRTDLNSGLLDGTPRGAELLMRTPMKRFGQIPELVGAAVFLSSDAASFVTGQCIGVDGGFLASGVNQ